jgi:thiol-disulfide isomerase/thioredoxin
MPELSLLASDGRPVMEAAGRWRAIYIDFWASWCGPCKLSFPWMNDMHEELAPLGLRIVGISLDRRESDALRFVEQVPTRFPIAMDPQAAAAKQFEVKAMPSAYLLRPNRELLYEHRGFRLEDRPMLERKLRSALM